MKTFDDIAVLRPELAQSYLQLLKAQPGRPMALFANRRVGKTFFLDHDLAPAAVKARLLPVYADLWLERANPLDAINHALQGALDQVMVPTSKAGRMAKTSVKKLGALGASITFGEAPEASALPSAPHLKLDALVVRLAQAAKQPILLMLDEIQALGEVPQGDQIIAALRAVLHKRRNEVLAVFTGSSQEGLARMVNTAGAPMYQFAQLMDFPVLGDDFLKLLAEHFGSVHRGRRPLLDDLRQVFARLGYKPALMKDLVKAMSAEGITDVGEGVKRMLSDERQVAGWRALLNHVSAFDRSVLLVVAEGLPPFGRETLDKLAQLQTEKPTLAKVRASVERLRKAGLVSKGSSGQATLKLDDPLLAQYLIGSVQRL
ncbi:MAG: hypothetical protein HEQ39_08265 [Rhizobacter sp.]